MLLVQILAEKKPANSFTHVHFTFLLLVERQALAGEQVQLAAHVAEALHLDGRAFSFFVEAFDGRCFDHRNIVNGYLVAEDEF